MGWFDKKPDKEKKRTDQKKRDQPLTCSDCNGRGEKPNARGGWDWCGGCNGTGFIIGF